MIVVAGEALVDLVPADAADTYVALAGGSPANVAVGLARLDVAAELLARLSGDAFGALLRRHLRVNGVGDRLVATGAEPATLAVAAFDEQARAAYTFYATGTVDWQWQPGDLPPLPPETQALHLGSLALALPPGAGTLESLMQRTRAAGQVLVSYDPNVRAALEPSPDAMTARVERQLAYAHVVKVSADDLAALYPGGDAEQVAAEWVTRGPSLVVVTSGAEGAVAVTARDVVRRPAPDVAVVDTVGAGDAFSAAMLAALWHRARHAGVRVLEVAARLDVGGLQELLDEAIAAASLTCTRRGADPPRSAELARWRHERGLMAGR